MSKNIQPEMGENIEQLLIKRCGMDEPRDEKNLKDKNFYDGIKSLLAVINKSGCANPEQAKLIEEKAHRVVEFQEELHGEKEPDFEQCAINERRFLDIITFINSCRLDCHDCLNPNCPGRDPNCPIEEAQKRAEQFKKAQKFTYDPSY